MANGLEMLNAVRRAAKGLKSCDVLAINSFDQRDLIEVTPGELELALDCDANTAARISADLQASGLCELSKVLGVRLEASKAARNLIPGEGIGRTSGIWNNGTESTDTWIEELDRIRHS